MNDQLQTALFLLASITTIWMGCKLILIGIQLFNTINMMFRYKEDMKVLVDYLDSEKKKSDQR